MAARSRPTREQTVDRLLDGALAVFAAHGFNGATVEQICAGSGLTRGAYYSSFRSRHELFLALYDRMTLRLEAMLDRALAASAGGPAGVPLALSLLAHDSLANRDWYLLNAEFSLYAIREPSAAPELASRRARLRHVIVDRLRRHLARQDRTLTVDPEILVRALIAISNEGIGQHLIEPSELNPDTMLATMLEPLVSACSEPM